jgi:hypothetical protein
LPKPFLCVQSHVGQKLYTDLYNYAYILRCLSIHLLGFSK